MGNFTQDESFQHADDADDDGRNEEILLKSGQVHIPSKFDHNNGNRTDGSYYWDPNHFDQSDDESIQSDVLAEPFLSDQKSNRMYDNRISQTKQSSYSYAQQGSTNYSSHNGDAQYNASYQANYEYNNDDPDISIGSLRSHDIMEHEEMYHFGTNMKRSASNRSANRIPSRPSSVRSNRSSIRNGDLEEYDIITADQYSRPVSRQSSLSRRSEPPPYRQTNQFQTNSQSRTKNSSGSYAVKRSQTLPKNNGHAYYREELRSSTLPRRPASTNTPEPTSEAIVEEERVNADGSTVLIRRVVTATTTQAYHENEVPKVEVHISPATETVISPPMSPNHQLNTQSHQQQTNSSSQMNSMSQYEQVTTTSYNHDNRYEMRTDHQYNEDNDERVSVRGSERAYSGSGSQRNSNPPYRPASQASSVHNRSSYGDNNESRTMNTSFEYTEFQTRNDQNQRRSSKSSSVKLPYGLQADGGGQSYITEEVITQNNMYLDEGAASGGLMDDDFNSGVVGSSTFGMEQTDYYGSENHADSMKKSAQQNGVDLLDLLMYLKTDDSALKANTAGYIMHLSYNDDDTKRRIREVDIIPLLVQLLDHEDEDCHRNAAGALKNLSYGHFIEDNKMAIRNCGGITACTRLLYRTSWIEVREHVTGVLWNISSIETIKQDVLNEAVEAVAELIVIPLSGWEKEFAEMGKKPGVVTWSTLLRNSTGVLRNVSSAGFEGRSKLRSIDGLVDSLVWILKAAIASKNNDINNKIVENVTCTLRNLSYKVDVEVDRNVYPDAAKVTIKDGTDSNINDNQVNDNSNKNGSKGAKKEPTTELVPQDATKTGCIGMKKKPFVKRKTNRSKHPLSNGNKKPPPEQWKYLVPVQEHRPTPLGVELLWQQETVTIYSYLLTNSTNPITLEAAAAAIHNLCGCKWNWAGLLRVHIRLQKGIPPMHDLLSVDQEYVVRSIAYALRNLSIDRTNKWSIGKFAHTGLLQVLPTVKTYETDLKPAGSTICAVLSVLQTLAYKDYYNSKYIKDGGGIEKLIGLTREASSGRKQEEKSLRVYSERVVLEANRVLLYMWEFKDCRDAIKERPWSHSKAEDNEKAFKNASLKKSKSNTDAYAQMDRAEDVVIASRDSRRYVDVEAEDDNENIDQSRVEKPPLEEYEMSNIGHGDVAHDETQDDEPLVRKNSSQKKKKNNWFKKDNTEESKKGSKNKQDEKAKLVKGEEDSFV